MSVEPISVHRAVKEQNAKLVSVPDSLEYAAKEAAEGGWTKSITVFYMPDGDKFMVGIRIAGCTTLEARGLMLSWLKEEILE